MKLICTNILKYQSNPKIFKKACFGKNFHGIFDNKAIVNKPIRFFTTLDSSVAENEDKSKNELGILDEYKEALEFKKKGNKLMA